MVDPDLQISGGVGAVGAVIQTAWDKGGGGCQKIFFDLSALSLV